VALEILNRFFVLLGRVSRGERAEVPTLASFGVFLARVQTIFASFQFPNHKRILRSYFPGATLAPLFCPTSGLAGFDS
jgi:hypothetical protein